MSIYDYADTYPHITPEQLQQCLPRCPDSKQWALAFNDAIEFFDVRDIAMLMAQVGHESADLTRLEESLNYSAERLLQVWPSRFKTLDYAQRYEHNPAALANYVYGGRMGNSEPGDGWRFIGRGPIQLTGRDNYTRFANAINSREPVLHPDCLTEPGIGALAACWFYVTHVPNGADIITATKRINGGTHGLADREARYQRCLEILDELE